MEEFNVVTVYAIIIMVTLWKDDLEYNTVSVFLKSQQFSAKLL